MGRKQSRSLDAQGAPTPEGPGKFVVVTRKPILLLHAALGLYLLSMVLPALNFDARPMAGWRLAALSITGIALSVFEPRIALELEYGQAPAYVLGALANVSFVCAYFTMLARRYLVIDQP